MMRSLPFGPITVGAGDGQSRTLDMVPVEICVHSKFNSRKTRDPKRIQALAERIMRNGFEETRAVWGRCVNEHVEVFAGGTRLEAARLAGLPGIPVIVHAGYGDDEIARLTDLDNENDEYHEPVNPVDVWAEYHRLRYEEGWEPKRIEEAKGVSQTCVSLRLRMNGLPGTVKKAILDGKLDEGHAIEISGVYSTSNNLAPWLTTEQAQVELTAEVLGKHRGSSAGIKPSVPVVRAAAERWKEMIRMATKLYNGLGLEYRAVYVSLLAERQARTMTAVHDAYEATARQVAKDKKLQEEETRRRHSEAEKERVAAEREARAAAFVAAMTAKIRHGDARCEIANAPFGFHLLLIDPPYGREYRSNRRVTSAKRAPMCGDTPDESLRLLAQVLKDAFGIMAEDSVALVFTGWRNEPDFRRVVEAAGFAIRGSLVWVKQNHGAGDLEGTFAPRHERIIHATKGNPKLAGRADDVLTGTNMQNSEHPTEKPPDLLKTLIEIVTTPGQIVVDMFAGSGSTLLAAMDAGRDFWGVEIDEQYYRRAVDAIYTRALGAVETEGADGLA